MRGGLVRPQCEQAGPVELLPRGSSGPTSAIGGSISLRGRPPVARQDCSV